MTGEPTLTTLQLEKKHSTELIAEAAMCIWEAMLDARYPGEQHPDLMEPMDRLWFDHGTVEMRHYAYRLALSALEVFELLGREYCEEHDLIPYDWEFIPAVVRLADWSSLYAADNSPKRIERELRDAYHA